MRARGDGDKHRSMNAGPGRSGSPSARAASEVLVALLRAELGTGAGPNGDVLRACDWNRLEQLGAHHGVLPILYKQLKLVGGAVPDALRQRMRLVYYVNALLNRRVRRLLEELGAALRAEGIGVVVLKGAALLETLYVDDPGLRQLSDVDLLVDERDVERAGACLVAAGLEPIGPIQKVRRGPLCDIHHVFARPGSIPVELHWRLFEPYLPYCFDLAEVRAAARPIPGLPDNVLAMAPEHELAHLCIHLERHALAYRSLLDREDWFELLTVPRGLGRLVWLYDIAAYMRCFGETLDWQRFVDRARRWAIDARVHAVLELCRRALAAAPPSGVTEALDRRPPRWTERLAHRVVFASYAAQDAERFSAVTRLSTHAVRAANTWAWLFPPSAYLRARHAGGASSFALRAAHFGQVIPELWTEARERLRDR